MKRFINWFAAQASRGDAVGDLARDVVADSEISGESIREVMKHRYGGITAECFKENGLMEFALDEFDRRKKEGNLYSFKQGNVSENLDLSKHLIAVVVLHALDSGIIFKDSTASLERTYFAFTALDGTPIVAWIKTVLPGELLIRAWFGTDGKDGRNIESLKEYEVLEHCQATVEMYAECGEFFGVRASEGPIRWVYNIKGIVPLKKMIELYKDRFECRKRQEGINLLIKH